MERLPHSPTFHPWVNRKTGVECRRTIGAEAEARYLRGLLGDHPCSQTGMCKHNRSLEGENKCSEKLLPGLGANALSQIAARLQNENDSWVSTGLQESPELARVANVLADWGRASAFRAG